jgi:sugar/nucleoside kinase (ribokinase family)
MPFNNTLDFLMFGHMAKDRNVVDGQGKTEAGGGIYFGSMVLRRMGLNVGVVTRLHPDDFPLLDELKQAQIKVFAKPAAETSGIENTYSSANMERRICKPLGFAGTIQIADVPDVTARIYAIVPIIAGEVDLVLLKALAARGPVALDIQGFVRVREGNDLVFRPWEQMAEGLKHVTYLKVDRAEAELLTGETDLRIAAQRLSGYGPREIVLTQSSGVTVCADGQIYQAPFTPRLLAGRTGRGDTCFSSYLGRRLTVSPAEACRFAAAVTTLKQEKPGPWDGTLAEVERVMANQNRDVQ